MAGAAEGRWGPRGVGGRVAESWRGSGRLPCRLQPHPLDTFLHPPIPSPSTHSSVGPKGPQKEDKALLVLPGPRGLAGSFGVWGNKPTFPVSSTSCGLAPSAGHARLERPFAGLGRLRTGTGRPRAGLAGPLTFRFGCCHCAFFSARVLVVMSCDGCGKWAWSRPCVLASGWGPSGEPQSLPAGAEGQQPTLHHTPF